MSSGNLYRRKDADGIQIRWIDRQGHRRGRLVKTTSVKEARAALAAEKAKVEKEKALGMPLPSEETFADWADEFLAIQERRIAPRVVKGKLSRVEYERQRGIVVKHLKPWFGKMKLGTIRRADVVKYIHDRTGQVSDGTVIKEMNTLKKLFNVALDHDKIASNPAQRVPMPQAPEGRTRHLTPEEWTRVFMACRIPPDKDGHEQEQWLQQAAGLAVSLGTRRGELLNTIVPDVDLRTRQAILRVTKNGKARTVYINDLGMQVFASMGIAERQRAKDRGVLFPSITAAQLTVRFIRSCQAAGIEDFSFHDLRHTYASHLRMQGADTHDLMNLLGHSDMRMTARYMHLTGEHLRAAASKLDGVLTLPDATK